MIRKNLPVTAARYLRRLTKIQHASQATRLDAAQSGNYACDNAAAPAQRSGQNLGPAGYERATKWALQLEQPSISSHTKTNRICKDGTAETRCKLP